MIGTTPDVRGGRSHRAALPRGVGLWVLSILAAGMSFGSATSPASADSAPPAPAGGLALALSVNQGAFTPGTRLVSALTIANTGPAVAVDAYVGVMLPKAAGASFGCPAGDAIALQTNQLDQAIVTCLSSSPDTFSPLVRNVLIPPGAPATTIPGAFTFEWPAVVPSGTYVLFVVLTQARTLTPLGITQASVTVFTPLPGRSVARQWDEAALAAIRLDIPRPPVHARNLFHLAVAMYDAWVAYDQTGTASPYLASDHQSGGEPERAQAMSFAAYRVLSARYARSVGSTQALARFDALMDWLGYDKGDTRTDGNSPAAVGNRIAAAIIVHGQTDGSNELNDYGDPTYAPVNDPLVVKLPGAVMKDPNRWQPLALDYVVTQNGIPLPTQVQTFVGSQWGHVVPFALAGALPYVDPGEPPHLGGNGDDLYKTTFVDNIEKSSDLDPGDGIVIDISPRFKGNNTLGTNDGAGYPVNPATGAAYEPNPVKRADWARVVAEFWADGPNSETPPGHWNVMANSVTDRLPAVKHIGGDGPAVNDLEWDVKLYFSLNGALHDAAVAAWGVKRVYDGVRPISAIRYMATRGQSSDPAQLSYDDGGLPLVPGLIELITRSTTGPGQPHNAQGGHDGGLAHFAGGGNPADPSTTASGVRWILAGSWVPYQKSTFVTPAFPGYPSGHSTFSRSAAEVLTAFTGSPFFPGGLSEFVALKNAFLQTELGPSEDTALQWATYFDAADEAGISRLYGGIHPFVDDFSGRRMGHQIGLAAYALAQRYFDGRVIPAPLRALPH